MRVGAAIAILATAACVDDAASGKTAAENGAKREVPAAQAAPTVEIAALDGTLPTEADVFAGLLREETARAALPRNTSLGITGALAKGSKPDGTYLVAVIDIEDGKGERLHRVVSDTLLTESEPLSVRSNGLRRFAAATAGMISEWYAASSMAPQQTLVEALPQAGDEIVTGSIASAEGLRPARGKFFEIEISPAPGDGTVALTRALDAQLTSQLETAPWLGSANFRIEGRVVAASRLDGRTDLWIDWTVTSAKGDKLGEIHQKNEIDAESIAGRWGDVAETAAEAAAKAVIAIVEPAPQTAPGPMAASRW